VRNKRTLKKRREIVGEREASMVRRTHKMYQKLNQNRRLKIALSTLAVFMLIGLTASLPYEEVAAQVPLPTSFGGRIIYSMPVGYWWVASYCIPHVMVASVGAYKGPIALMLPPGSPRGYYNYFTPGVQLLGNFVPTPIIGSCPYPVFPAVFMGSTISPR
jgi:hypothetical protein